MAEQYQQIAVNPGSSQAAVQGTPNVTPALEDLMQGIASGMISLGDLQKRNADIPLEAARRNDELTDLKELRPLQRQAQTAQLQNLQAKQAFEAESLPILNDIKREQLKAEYSDVLQHGVPSSTIKIFNATVPGLIPYDPDKLYDKKTGGQLNTSYALELIGKAIEKAEKLKLNAKFTGPVQQKATDATGKLTETTTVMNQITGEAVGAPIKTDVKEVNVAEVAAKDRAAMAGLSNDVLKERNSSDIIKAYVPQQRSFDAVDEIRNRKTPPKNADDLAILYQYVRILDPTSAVREGEVKFTQSTVPGVQAIYNQAQGLFRDSNRTFDPSTRANLYATIDSLRAGAEKSVIPELKRISNLAIDRGMPLSQAFTEPELSLLVNGPKVPGAPPSVPGAAPAGAPAVPGVAAGAPAAATPVISTQDETAAAAEANALPPNVPFFQWNGKNYHNPNYRP